MIFAGYCVNLTISNSKFDYSMKSDIYGRWGMRLFECDNIYFDNISFIEGYHSALYLLSCDYIYIRNCSFYKTRDYCLEYYGGFYHGEIVDNIFTIGEDAEILPGYNEYLYYPFTIENNTVISI